MNHIFLSRRNLLTLLNKLERPESRKTIIKCDTAHKKYPCTTPTIVTAVEDSDYYTDRGPGDVMHPDQPRQSSE